MKAQITHQMHMAADEVHEINPDHCIVFRAPDGRVFRLKWIEAGLLQVDAVGSVNSEGPMMIFPRAANSIQIG